MEPASLFDPLRKKWVKATPEEQVRQGLIQWLLEKGGYPQELISTELGLSKIAQTPAHRRFDILCFKKKDAELLPLLLIECKAKTLNPSAKYQVLAYNSSIKAPFLALVSQNEARFSRAPFENWDNGLPLYQDLIDLPS